VTAADPGARPGVPSQQAAVAAALVLLDRMGLSPADLLTVPADRPAVPTFAEYVPVVSAAVTPGTRRAYGQSDHPRTEPERGQHRASGRVAQLPQAGRRPASSARQGRRGRGGSR
jgi:integrase/recombinase XerC